MNKPEQNRLRLKLVWQSLEKVNEWSLLVLREKQAALVNKKNKYQVPKLRKLHVSRDLPH